MTHDSGAQRARAAAPRGRLLAAALLIALVVAGIRGASPSVSFRGPWHHHGTQIGAVLEVVLAALMFAVAARGARAPAGLQPAARLRDWLRVVLLVGLVVTPVSIAITAFAGLHARVPARPAPELRPGRTRQPLAGSAAASGHAELVILYGLLGLALLAVIIACLILASRRHRRAARRPTAGDPGDPGDQQEDLSRAVQSGQIALRQVDDARAAIIACYVAMERSLAEAGAARDAAETPDELLARAASAGLVRGQAGRQLTSLFYEARFSSHPLPPARKRAAQEALAALEAAAIAAAPGTRAAG